MPGIVLVRVTVVNKQSSWLVRKLDSWIWHSATKITYLNHRADRVTLVLKAAWDFPLWIAPGLSSLATWLIKLPCDLGWKPLLTLLFSWNSLPWHHNLKTSLLRGHCTQQVDWQTLSVTRLLSVPKILLFSMPPPFNPFTWLLLIF